MLELSSELGAFSSPNRKPKEGCVMCYVAVKLSDSEERTQNQVFISSSGVQVVTHCIFGRGPE